MSGIYKGNEHEFGEYITDIDFLEKILDENKVDKIAEQLAKYLIEKYKGTENSYGKHKGVARKKALQILGKWSPHLTDNPRNVDNLIERRYPPQNLSKKTTVEKKKILIDAVNKGFVKDFNLHEPWHWNVFTDNKQPSTLPFQHDSVITYSQRSRHEFYSEEYCDKLVEEGHPNADYPPWYDRFFRHQSIFTVGGIKAGNKNKDMGLTGEGALINGVYTNPKPQQRQGFPETEGVILELQIPTQSLIITASNGRNQVDMESLSEMINHFDSPEEFKSYNKDLGEWIVEPTFEIEKDVAIPLQWVTGVYDSKFADDYLNFIPLSRYKSLLEEAFPERMPGSNSKKESGRDHKILLEIKEIERHIAHPDFRNKGPNDTELLEDDYGRLTKVIKKLNETDRQKNTEEYFALLEEYDKEINGLKEILEDLLSKEIKFRNVYTEFTQLEKFEKQNGWDMILRNFLERNNKRVIYLMNGFYSGKISHEEAEEVLEKIARDVSGLPIVNLQR